MPSPRTFDRIVPAPWAFPFSTAGSVTRCGLPGVSTSWSKRPGDGRTPLSDFRQMLALTSVRLQAWASRRSGVRSRGQRCRRRSTTAPGTWRCGAATPGLTGGSSWLSPRRGSTAGRAARRRLPGRRGCAFSRARQRRNGRAFARARDASRTRRRAHPNGTVVPTSSGARCASSPTVSWTAPACRAWLVGSATASGISTGC